MPTDPREHLRQWLPHICLLALALAAGFWLAWVLLPLAGAMLLAAALAALTYPGLYAPIAQRLPRWLPGLSIAHRRQLAALIAVVLLSSVAASLMLAVLLAVFGDLGGTARAILAVAIQDEKGIAMIADQVQAKVKLMSEQYSLNGVSRLPFTPEDARSVVLQQLQRTQLGPEALKFLVTGTGSNLAEAALTVVTLFYLYAEGPVVTSALTAWLPLSPDQRATLTARYRAIATHLLTGTIARAAVTGAGIGALAWLIGGINPILSGLFAAVVALLPLVGPALAWMPLALVEWSHGNALAATLLSVLCLAWTWLVGYGAGRLASRLGTDSLWIGFLLFLALVGGIITFGLRGAILGPAAVLAVVVAASFLPPLYGMRAFGSVTDQDLERESADTKTGNGTG